MSPTQGYHRGLDGLRGVAVLSVMLYHSGVIRGGFLGVDVFFTLSGFLITSLLLEEHAATGTVDIWRFYVRRALRLLPALLVFLVFWGGMLLALTPPSFWPLAGGYVLAVLCYVANWTVIYWMPIGIFGHTWSLAIEEQFYLVWPVALVLLVRWVRRPTRIAAVLTLAAAASLAWRLSLALAGASFPRIYAATDTHADGLLIGAVLAVLLAGGWLGVGGSGGVRRRVAAVSAIGLAGLLLTAAPVPGHAYGVSALAALATAGIILHIGTHGSLVARLLECRWLANVGRVSYGLYLWHFPVFVNFEVLRVPGETAAPLLPSALAWAVTGAAALASYFLIERPFLAYKARLVRPSPLPDPDTRLGAELSPAVPAEGRA